MMKFKIVLFAFFQLLSALSSNAQNVPTTKTQYSKIEKGGVGKENFSFSLSNSELTIFDLDYNKSETYGPLKLGESGFDNNKNYFETYSPDVAQDPANWRKWRNNMRSYKLVFNKKGGNLIIVVEVKAKSDESKSIKTYFTEEGYSQFKSATATKLPQTSQQQDLANQLANASSLGDLESSIKKTFSSDKQTNYSSDVSVYTLTYINGNKRALITYKVSNDKIQQVTFLLPKVESIEISKKSFITNFSQKEINGNSIWMNSKTGLLYETGFDEEVGIIVVKTSV